jgi:hypothetical protein
MTQETADAALMAGEAAAEEERRLREEREAEAKKVLRNSRFVPTCRELSSLSAMSRWSSLGCRPPPALVIMASEDVDTRGTLAQQRGH